MGSRVLPAVRVLCALLAAGGAGGCGLFHDYRQMTVRVIDGDTRRPIAGAEVRTSYLAYLMFNRPPSETRTTDHRGLATIPVTDYAVNTLSAKKTGYPVLERITFYDRKAIPLTGDAIRRLPKKPASEIHAEIELWATSAPQVHFVIPTGYRGPVKVRYEETADPGDPPDGRRFRFAVSPSGHVTVRGPAYIRTDSRTIYAARHEAGYWVADETADPDVVTLRRVSDGFPDRPTALFVVGDARDADRLDRVIIPQIARNVWTSDKAAYDRLFDE